MPIYPAVLATAFVLSLWVDYALHPASAVRAIVTTVVIGAALTVLAGVVLRSRHRGAAAVAAWLGLTVYGLPTAAAGVLAVGGLAAIGVVDRRHGRIPWPRLTGMGNAISIALVGVIAVRWVFNGGVAQLVRDLSPVPPSAAAATATAPDIYLVLLDAYPRADWTKELFDFDNRAFLTALEDRGFDVYPDSRSNYDSTTLTLNSLLNLRYLDDLPAFEGLRREAPGTTADYRNGINDNAAFEVLRQHGYETIAVTPGWEEVAIRRGDRLIDSGALNELESAVLQSTSLGPAVDAVDPDFFGRQTRDRVVSNLRTLVEVSIEVSSRPRFVFVHVPSPHNPVVFNADGSARTAGIEDIYSFGAPPSDRAAMTAAYTGQLTALNDRVLATLDLMEPPGTRERVVIIFSDHGSLTGLAGSEERLTNFLAARSPGHRAMFQAHPTPVNLLRLLFSTYLNENFPALPDRSYETIGFRPPAFHEFPGDLTPD